MEEKNYWRKCASCKREIPFAAYYQKCSVSSCRKLVFCSVRCWDEHVPVMNHKSAWAQEEKAPLKIEVGEEPRPKRRIVANSAAKSMPSNSNVPNEVLIVASKMKSYVKEKHGLNCSSNVLDPLSDIVRRYLDEASERAKIDGRKTLLDRDF